MLIEAALLPRNLLSAGNQIHTFFCASENFSESIYYGSAKAEVTVPVPQHCIFFSSKRLTWSVSQWLSSLYVSTGIDSGAD